jgi:DNA-binding MarR family transcriptional regulator
MDESQRGDGRERISDGLDQAGILVMRHLVDRAGLTATAYQALTTLTREGPTRLTALAAAESISQPSMTQLIQRLERQGLTTRVNDPEDGRAALVDVSNEGRALLARQYRRRRERLNELLATLSPEDEAALTLAMHVALPIIGRLIRSATSAASNKTAVSIGADAVVAQAVAGAGQ